MPSVKLNPPEIGLFGTMPFVCTFLFLLYRDAIETQTA